MDVGDEEAEEVTWHPWASGSGELTLEGGEPRGGGGAPGGFQVERQDSMISRQLQAGFESRGWWGCLPVSAVSTGLRVPGMEGQLAGKRRK